MSRVLITGARGFLGNALIDAARTAGCTVAALSRTQQAASDEGVTWHAVDLGAADAPQKLAPALEGVCAVIHAAASFSGDEAAHARDTLSATEHLIAAMKACAAPPKLVLVSSFSVYDIPALDDFALLTEDSPVIAPNAARDAYAKAKRRQEILALESGLDVVILRPGAIYGPQRLWSAQLGFAKAGRVVCPGGDALVPAVGVIPAAQSLVQAALRALPTGTVINLIDPNPPTQGGWLAALGLKAIFVPRPFVLKVAAKLNRGPSWTARFKPLAYDARRARDLLGHVPPKSFPQAVLAAKAQEDSAS